MEYTERMFARKGTGEIIDFGTGFDEYYHKSKEMGMSEEEYKEQYLEEIPLSEAVRRLKLQGIPIDYEEVCKASLGIVDNLGRLLKQSYDRRTKEHNDMMEQKEVKSRHDIIQAMEVLMRNMNNEDLFMNWLAMGVPDGGDDDDVWDIAKDEELYNGAVSEFLRIMQCSPRQYDYFPYVSHVRKVSRPDADIYGQKFIPGGHTLVRMTVLSNRGGVRDWEHFRLTDEDARELYTIMAEKEKAFLDKNKKEVKE